jgi:hypothetical protein
LYIGPSQVKIVSLKQNFFGVSAAPSWQVVLENTKRKVGVVRSLELWKTRSMHLIDTADSMGKGKVVATTWHGQAAVKVVAVVKDADPLKEKYEMLYEESPGRELTVSTEEIVYAKLFPIAPQIQVVLEGFDESAMKDALTVEHTRNYANSRTDKLLQTFSVKKIAVDASEFSYPKGFKQVDNVKEITLDSQKAKDAVYLLQDLFVPTQKK